MGKVLFSQVRVWPQGGTHLRPIILPSTGPPCPFSGEGWLPQYLASCPFLGGGGGGYPIQSWETEQHSEHLLRGWRYASYVHTGGLCCVSVVSSDSCTVQYLNDIQVTRQLVMHSMTSHLPWRRGICPEMDEWCWRWPSGWGWICLGMECVSLASSWLVPESNQSKNSLRSKNSVNIY